MQSVFLAILFSPKSSRLRLILQPIFTLYFEIKYNLFGLHLIRAKLLRNVRKNRRTAASAALVGVTSLSYRNRKSCLLYNYTQHSSANWPSGKIINFATIPCHKVILAKKFAYVTTLHRLDHTHLFIRLYSPIFGNPDIYGYDIYGS